MMKKWYETIVFIFARPTDWIPMPVTICWSEKERRSFRAMGADVLLRRPRRMMVEARRREMQFVTMKERRTWWGLVGDWYIGVEVREGDCDFEEVVDERE